MPSSGEVWVEEHDEHTGFFQPTSWNGVSYDDVMRTLDTSLSASLDAARKIPGLPQSHTRAVTTPPASLDHVQGDHAPARRRSHRWVVAVALGIGLAGIIGGVSALPHARVDAARLGARASAAMLHAPKLSDDAAPISSTADLPCLIPLGSAPPSALLTKPIPIATPVVRAKKAKRASGVSSLLDQGIGASAAPPSLLDRGL